MPSDDGRLWRPKGLGEEGPRFTYPARSSENGAYRDPRGDDLTIIASPQSRFPPRPGFLRAGVDHLSDHALPLAPDGWRDARWVAFWKGGATEGSESAEPERYALADVLPNAVRREQIAHRHQDQQGEDASHHGDEREAVQHDSCQ